jgi:hypothetical protein
MDRVILEMPAAKDRGGRKGSRSSRPPPAPGGAGGERGGRWGGVCGRRGKEKKINENGGTHVWRGNGGPPRMEAERGDLEGYAKWRLV